MSQSTTVSINNLSRQPRYEWADADLPGNSTFWQFMLEQSDVFAHDMSQGQKAGLGAQLWLYNPEHESFVFVGQNRQSKISPAEIPNDPVRGRAEIVNLSAKNRQTVIDFLTKNAGQGWKLVQLSSGESCPNARARQHLFAEELIERGLMDRGDFHVVFRASFSQTRRDSRLDNEPYDNAFRLMNRLHVFSAHGGLRCLRDTFSKNADIHNLLNEGRLITTGVESMSSTQLDDKVKTVFDVVGDRPLAIIVNAQGDKILGIGLDKRGSGGEQTIDVEHTAIIEAIRQAAEINHESGMIAPWNMSDARLLTNIGDIGPASYARALTSHLPNIEIVEEYTSETIDILARELPWQSNKITFSMVAGIYNYDGSPIRTTFVGDKIDAYFATLYKSSPLSCEDIQRPDLQSNNVLDNGKIYQIDGTAIDVTDVMSSRNDTKTRTISPDTGDDLSPFPK